MTRQNPPFSPTNRKKFFLIPMKQHWSEFFRFRFCLIMMMMMIISRKGKSNEMKCKLYKLHKQNRHQTERQMKIGKSSCGKENPNETKYETFFILLLLSDYFVYSFHSYSYSSFLCIQNKQTSTSNISFLLLFKIIFSMYKSWSVFFSEVLVT